MDSFAKVLKISIIQSHVVFVEESNHAWVSMSLVNSSMLLFCYGYIYIYIFNLRFISILRFCSFFCSVESVVWWLVIYIGIYLFFIYLEISSVSHRMPLPGKEGFWFFSSVSLVGFTTVASLVIDPFHSHLLEMKFKTIKLDYFNNNLL